jgi:hypothetical protein
VPDPQANFVWLPAGARAADLAVALERAGLVTRPFAGEGVRITVGTSADTDRVLDAMDAIAPGLGLAEAWLLPVADRARQVQVFVDRLDAARAGVDRQADEHRHLDAVRAFVAGLREDDWARLGSQLDELDLARADEQLARLEGAVRDG